MREDWEFKKLGDVCKTGSGGTPLKAHKDYYEGGDIPWLLSGEVSQGEIFEAKNFITKNLAFIDQNQADKLSNVIVESEDVLLNITGASITRCCVVPEKLLPARVNQHVSIIRVKKNILMSNFLHYALISKEYKSKLLKIGEKGGTTRQALTKAQIEDFLISYPKSLTKQQQIVEKLDALSAETKRLEMIYQQKLNDLEELKKSILQKAFNGELTKN